MVRPLLIMDTTNEPIETISAWQEWYKRNKVVSELDEPLVTKDSRECLHDTTHVISSCGNLMTDYVKGVSFQKAKEYFADTLAEFASELSGKELYKAFYAAAVDNMECVEKEYKNAKQIVDMLRDTDV